MLFAAGDHGENFFKKGKIPLDTQYYVMYSMTRKEV